MENKVKFHALERLDLVDVNALQDNMYTYMAKAFGNLIGNASGLLQRPNKSNITINSTNEHIEFPDFIYIEAQDDTDYADSFENRMIAFDASLANGDCSYDSALQLVQQYYDDNSALPDGPRASGYNSNNSNLFPYIWVLKSEIETTQDNRRFWDTSSNNETTTPVNTRKKYIVNFTLNHLTPAGGYTRIGRIIDWDVTGNTVELPSASQSIELYTFTDDVYFTDGDFTLDSSSEFASLLFEGGLRTAFRTIRKQIADIRSNGSADASIPNITDTPFNVAPVYSLDALYQKSINVSQRQLGFRHSSVITISNVQENNTPTITKTEWTPSGLGQADSANHWFSVDVGFDYNIFGITAFSSGLSISAPYTNSDIYTNTDTRNAFLSHIYVSIPSSFANFGIMVNARPFYEFDDTDKVYTKSNTFQCFPVVNYTLANDPDSDMLYVNELENLVDSDGNAVNNLYGFRIGIGGLYDRDGSSAGYFTNTLNELQKDLRIKLEISLIKRN